jgi:hypothetical protein
MKEMGTIPAELNRLFASEVQNHEVPNFSHFFRHSHSKVGWPSYISTKLDHSKLKVKIRILLGLIKQKTKKKKS